MNRTRFYKEIGILILWKMKTCQISIFLLRRWVSNLTNVGRKERNVTDVLVYVNIGILIINITLLYQSNWIGPGYMAQKLRALTDLSEELSSFPSCVAVPNALYFQLYGLWNHFFF